VELSVAGTRPFRVGISACLLGQQVRYDGGHKRHRVLMEVLGPHVEWVPVCPEVEMGMGTPREPVQLVRVGAATRMIAVRSGIDHTDAMNAWAARRLEALAVENLDGYVLKKDSPSCGKEGVRVEATDAGSGLFAAALLARFPTMPIEEEGGLADERRCAEFIERLRAYHGQKIAGMVAPERLSPFRRVRVTRVGRPEAGGAEDLAAAEEPLEIRLHGQPFAVIMRTPGRDRDLAAGFLLSESVIQSPDDLGAVEHCRHPHHPQVHNVVDVYLVGQAAKEMDGHLERRRNVLTSSSCGLCGRVTIESLGAKVAPIDSSLSVPSPVIASLPSKLRERQRVFDETGGLHAAGLFTPDGECESSAEDVGRHNAVDKIVGARLLDGRVPIPDRILMVSGRASFEILQKAWIAGIPIVCAVSAPSSLAIELADEAGITLLGFVRNGGFNLYTHPSRIAL
jgi:FdhD protein